MLAALIATRPAGGTPPEVAAGEGVGLFWHPDRERRKKLADDDDETVLLLAAVMSPWRK